MSGLALDSVATEQRGFGGLLREWRTTRGLSQLSLSMRSGVSSRHLSYLETGRAQPSRDMVLTLAQTLEVPLRDRNALLQAAGFAAIYRETPLQAQLMGPVRDAINLLVRSTEPNPTFVVNRRYDVLNSNETGRWLLATFTQDLNAFTPPYNFGKLLASAKGMREHVENWADVGRKVFGRLKRELGSAPQSRDAADEELLATIAPVWDELGAPPSPGEALPLLVPVRLRRGSLGLRLFTTIATLGTPLDVTLQELRVEMLFPADEDSKRALMTRSS